jgi:hypothetical protein
MAAPSGDSLLLRFPCVSAPLRESGFLTVAALPEPAVTKSRSGCIRRNRDPERSGRIGMAEELSDSRKETCPQKNLEPRSRGGPFLMIETVGPTARGVYTAVQTFFIRVLKQRSRSSIRDWASGVRCGKSRRPGRRCVFGRENLYRIGWEGRWSPPAALP